MTTVAPPLALKSKRLVSLDAFRGATILLMITVNNPGTWGAVYTPLLHAPWHGWTITDLVFPFFLFIVGVAIVFAFRKRLERGAERGPLVGKTAKRAAFLFGFGILMAAYPFFQFVPEFGLRPGLERLRIMGVLQRIAICYFAASVLFLYTTRRTQFIVGALVLIGYWLAMTLIPVPGHGAGLLDVPEATLSAYLDRLVLTPDHLWSGAQRMWDPEGLFSTLPAIVTVLLGLEAGRILSDPDREPLTKTAHLLLQGMLWMTVGYVWDWFFPINKALWTSSYVCFTAGLGMSVLGVFYWITDVRGHVRWAQPFVAYGVNAITVFVMSGIVAKTIIYTRIPTGGGETTSVQRWIFLNIFDALIPSTKLASFVYAMTWVTLWYLVLRVMYKNRFIIKV